MEIFLFLALSVMAIVFASLMLVLKNAVHSALCLIGNFACVAVLYLMLDAPFLGMVQIAVYAGAIMVLFLFVIMLLGADQTTDTNRSFRGFTGVATVLALVLFFAFALPLIGTGLNLPKPQPTTALVRVVQSAGVDQAVTLKLSGDSGEPVSFSDIAFGSVSDAVTVTAGTYNYTLTKADGSPVAPPASITLEAGQTVSLLIAGELNVNAGKFPSLLVVPTSSAAPVDKETRLLVFNGYVDTPLSLVDLGANDVLDIRARDVLDANGEPVKNEAGEVQKADKVSDSILAENVAYGAVPVPTSFKSGTYHLALVNTANEIVARVEGFTLKEKTEQLFLFVPDFDATLGADGTYRPMVLRNEALATRTAAVMGSPASIGQILFTDYLLPVNIVGLLLLVALVGVVVLTRPDGEKQERRLVQRRKVSRPLASVITTQTGSDVTDEAPQLEAPKPSEAGD